MIPDLGILNFARVHLLLTKTINWAYAEFYTQNLRSIQATIWANYITDFAKEEYLSESVTYCDQKLTVEYYFQLSNMYPEV